jgi:hypothetical protein
MGPGLREGQLHHQRSDIISSPAKRHHSITSESGITSLVNQSVALVRPGIAEPQNAEEALCHCIVAAG